MKRPAVEPITIKAADAAKAAGIPPRTLREMTKAGKVPSARQIGKNYYYVLAEYREWILNQAKVEAH